MSRFEPLAAQRFFKTKSKSVVASYAPPAKVTFAQNQRAMKKIYWVALAMIGVAIYMFTMAAEDLSTYSTFADAARTDKKVKVAVRLSKDKPMEYDPTVDANRFTFYATDANGEEHKVVLLAAKPQDFELSEQVVLTGRMKGDEFVATEMLMKCPSKYKDEEIKVRARVGQE